MKNGWNLYKSTAPNFVYISNIIQHKNNPIETLLYLFSCLKLRERNHQQDGDLSVSFPALSPDPAAALRNQTVKTGFIYDCCLFVPKLGGDLPPIFIFISFTLR